jgi:hypothetical protein
MAAIAVAGRVFPLPSSTRSRQGEGPPDFRAAAGAACAHSTSSTTAAVTIGLLPQAEPPQGHFRRAFSALKFMKIP